jgi:CDP-2,3-bis-(O-geranylgeranyl)-sn-glycerol synthase
MMIPLEALWIILPAYIANASAVMLGGGKPIDSGKRWRGKPLFGEGKTWRGFLGGVSLGTAIGYLQATFFPDYFGEYPIYLFIVLSLATGAMIGDLGESFLKRQIGKQRGEKWLIADQLDFLIGGLAIAGLSSIILEITDVAQFNWFLGTLTIWHLVFLFVFTPFLHFAINIIGYKTGVKEVPW